MCLTLIKIYNCDIGSSWGNQNHNLCQVQEQWDEGDVASIKIDFKSKLKNTKSKF